MNPKKNYSAPALEKGLDIIELLSSSILGYSQAEIAKELNRSVNEIYRMLAILVSRNYIELDEDTERYKLTFKLLQLSSKHQPIKNLMQKSLPMMREVAQMCNHSVHLSIYYAGKLLVIGQVDSPSSFNYSVKIGSTFDLLETSSGRVLLAFQTEEERLRRLKRRKLFIKLQKKKNIILLSVLEKKFSSKIIFEIIKNNCEVVKSLQIDGVTNISVPIFDHTDQAIAAVTIPFLQRINSDSLNDLNLIKTTKLLKEQALQLSKNLGFRSP
ncbi:IclR family transcriptional regulator C-terminal domain-containing protein [Alphaproteobacteria bacterium]|nr:IclR family transcriptional regulator C-terminal domain-containing protein [Alphaproteobacteria bacterium]